MFEVGQKVVCIDDGLLEVNSTWIGGEKPTVGGIYTISATGVDDEDGAETVKLLELKREAPPPFDWYGAFRFRPLVSDHSSVFESWVAPIFKKSNIDA